MNVIFFTGNVGSDSEIRPTSSGEVLGFSVAVRQGISRDAESKWYRCSIWGQRGSSLKQHIVKGAKVTCVGVLTIGEYEGKPQFNVNVTEIDPFCGGKRDAPSDDSGQSSAPRQQAPQRASRDDYGAGKEAYQPTGGFDDIDDDFGDPPF